MDSAKLEKTVSTPLKIWVFLAGVFADLVLMSAGFLFQAALPAGGAPALAVALLPVFAVALLRRNRRYKKKFLVRLIFIFSVAVTLDVMVLMHAGIYGWHPLLLPAAPAAYLAALRFRSSRFLRWDGWQCLLIPLFATFLLSMVGDSPQSKGACGTINSQPGVRLLFDSHRESSLSKVRDLLEIEGTSKVLLYYRKGFGTSRAGTATLDCVDIETGRKTAWLTSGEVIGLHRHTADGDIYAVVLDPYPGKDKGVSYTDIVRFDADGNVKNRLPVPKGRSNYYSASIYSTGDDLLVVVESNFYEYGPAAGTIKEIPVKNPVMAYSTVLRGRYLFGVNSRSPLVGVLIPSSVLKYDLTARRLVSARRGGILGYYDIKEIGDTGRFVASNLWTGGGAVFDSNLNPLGEINFPRGVRNFGLDRRGRHLFAPNFFSGHMRVVDMKSNRLLENSYFVGKGTRAVKTAANGRILIANSCGLVEVDPETMARGR